MYKQKEYDKPFVFSKSAIVIERSYKSSFCNESSISIMGYSVWRVKRDVQMAVSYPILLSMLSYIPFTKQKVYKKPFIVTQLCLPFPKRTRKKYIRRLCLDRYGKMIKK